MGKRKNRSPEEMARRAKIRELLQESNISSMTDIQKLFKETIAEFMENGLDAELDEELGYSRYDYKNKDTDNSRNGHSSKTLKTSFGEVDIEKDILHFLFIKHGPRSEVARIKKQQTSEKRYLKKPYHSFLLDTFSFLGNSISIVTLKSL